MLSRSTPVLCAALLAACAGNPPAAPAARKGAPTIAAAMAEVDAAVLAGQNDKAYAILKQAGSTFPTDKTPWVRMAQMRFDSTNYGDAIANALEALERDPDDTLANSIVAVSGLRVTSKALTDLSKKNNLTGNVRTEAQDLAKLLRTSLNEEILVPGGARGAAGRAKDVPKKVVANPAAPAAPRAGSSDPFGALK
ncbi:tetratricopeptide repeat protein [Massilia forsythiae]|uniref:Tetratricopeptide repeat protein n=2 Tax=Massilia forsythiae TaxID=2728020 RepID=A0A7Z2W1R0_9BURK|nr:tetratricopeptide repeat protein [Massilia forsythiae]